MNIKLLRRKKLILDLIRNKQRTAYYKVTLWCCSGIRDQVSYLHHFDDEEVVSIESLKDSYGKPEYLRHLDKVFKDTNYLRELSVDQQITDIDLSVRYYKYEFTVYEVNPDESLSKKTVLVSLTDDEYAELLALRLCDGNFTVNTLEFANSNLHRKVMRSINDSYCNEEGYYISWRDAPYVVHLTEVNRDAATIAAEHPELCHKPVLQNYGSKIKRYFGNLFE